ncbi:serine hydrolase domain-containing protein [Massilia endophytica]|uniref:serine hydrolase domain-containing protein n=1 Tax=Massilia endophytica TaxID=2899220 RepID=UPI001E3D8C19|nr:serine hydrolase [Massilia endophytica]UGQ47413.1 beta-lactamase family protein [Massilia endophytica]
MNRLHTLLRLTPLLLLSACASFAPQRPLDTASTAQIDSAVRSYVAERKLPGAVYWMEHEGASYQQAYGKQSYETGSADVTLNTLYDAASLSKVVSTAPSVLILAEEGKISLDSPLVNYFPECANGGKEAITIRHLLTHSSGLPASLPAKPGWRGDEAAHKLACNQTVTHTPGTFFRYSDINYVLLGQLVQKVSGMPLSAFAQQRIFTPLGMKHTGYLPLARFTASGIAPTQKAQEEDGGKSAHIDLPPGQTLQGVVHDPTARFMGGVGGSAGIFTTAGDLARYARMLLNGGELDGVRVMRPETVRLLTTRQSPDGLPARAMGMDIDSPYARPRGTVFPVGSFGHTGFTGCILWVDPNSKTFYVFLSNRVYPDDKSNILPLYGVLGTLTAQAAGLKAP